MAGKPVASFYLTRVHQAMELMPQVISTAEWRIAASVICFTGKVWTGVAAGSKCVLASNGKCLDSLTVTVQIWNVIPKQSWAFNV